MNTQKSITQDFPSAPDVDQDSPQTPQAGSKTGGGDTFNTTPGPWVYAVNDFGGHEVGLGASPAGSGGGVSGYRSIYQTDDYLRVTVSSHSTEADARLIAAAPDLLEFVESLVDANGPHADINGSSVIPRAYELLRKITGKEAA